MMRIGRKRRESFADQNQPYDTGLEACELGTTVSAGDRHSASRQQLSRPGCVPGADEDCDGIVDEGTMKVVRVRAKSLCPHVSALR